ncbi:MAG: ribonuclease T2 [Rhizobiaceae bacterium]
MNARTLKSLAFLAVALAAAVLLQRQGEPTRAPRGEDGFAFYVLALSWSPSYCEIEGDGADRDQCASGRPYAFVVHGLWPQHERGYPRDCATDERGPSAALVQSLLDIMPAPGLVRHQWRAHGSCTGLAAEGYFARLRAAFERVTIPAAFRRITEWKSVAPGEVETAFRQANPGLAAAAIAPVCGKRFLSEVRICLTKSLEFRECPEVDQAACRLENAVMPPVRGG